MHIRLQALDALTLIGELARAALPSLRREASAPRPKGIGADDYLGIASRYLVAVLEGTYKPDGKTYGMWPPIKFPPPTL